MYYTPRTIAFLCELLQPPQAPDPQALQRVHNRLFSESPPLYGSFHVTPDGAILSNVTTQPGAASSVAFQRDRIQFREELSGLTVDEFSARVLRVVELACAARPCPLFPAQVVTLRSLVNPQHFKDSREFLRSGVLGLGAELAAFGREPQLYGLRLVFPATPEAPNLFTLRIESFANDPRSVFVEVQGSFGPVVPARGLEPLEANVRATYAFVVDRVLPFLGPFDARGAT